MKLAKNHCSSNTVLPRTIKIESRNPEESAASRWVETKEESAASRRFETKEESAASRRVETMEASAA